MRRCALLAAALLALGSNAAVLAQDGGPGLVQVLIPAFDSPGSKIGLNAATVLNLSIWRTLQRAPGGGDAFGKGQVTWMETPLSEAPEDAAARQQAQLVLWGSAFTYGTGAVVEARLTVLAPTEADRRRQTWSVELSDGAGRHALVQLDALPEREFSFRPLPLKSDQLAAYARPDILQIYDKPDSDRVLGRVGGAFLALEQNDRYARIQTSDPHDPAGERKITGYLKLPPRAGSATIANFTGAVIRVLRTDWSGARALLTAVENDPTLPTSIAIDAKLLRAYCLERQNESGIAPVTAALKLNPAAVRSLRYSVMVELAQASRVLPSGGSHEEIGRIAAQVRMLLKGLGGSSAPDDPWLRGTNDALKLLDANR